MAPRPEVLALAKEFLKRSSLPARASDDALHISFAVVFRLDYLLPWNCKHIANPHSLRKLAEIASDLGYRFPTVCTPYQFFQEDAE